MVELPDQHAGAEGGMPQFEIVADDAAGVLGTGLPGGAPPTTPAAHGKAAPSLGVVFQPLVVPLGEVVLTAIEPWKLARRGAEEAELDHLTRAEVVERILVGALARDMHADQFRPPEKRQYLFEEYFRLTLGQFLDRAEEAQRARATTAFSRQVRDNLAAWEGQVLTADMIAAAVGDGAGYPAGVPQGANARA